MDPRQTVIFRWLAAGDSGDFGAFDLLLHPDAVVHAPAGLSTTSAEAEKQVWREGKKAIPDIRHQVQEVVVAGDVEMARVVVTGKLTSDFGGIEGTGRSFRIDQAVMAHLRDGKIAEALGDSGHRRAQCAGVPEVPDLVQALELLRNCAGGRGPEAGPERTAIVAMWCDRDPGAPTANRCPEAL